MRLSLALLVTALGSAAAAQPSPPTDREARRAPVYMSLMGEPVRGAPGERPFERWLAGADANADGAIDLPEMFKDAARFFATLDLNRDDRIDADEMKRYENEIAPAPLRAAAGGSAGRPRRIRQGGPGGEEPPITGTRLPDSGASNGGLALAAPPQPVAMADTDLNGSVTAKEFAAAAARRFAAHDRNRDALLKPDELPQPRIRVRGR